MRDLVVVVGTPSLGVLAHFGEIVASTPVNLVQAYQRSPGKLAPRRPTVRKSKFTESQIVATLKQVEGGRQVKDVCHELSISDATYYARRSKEAPKDLAGSRVLGFPGTVWNLSSLSHVHRKNLHVDLTATTIPTTIKATPTKY